MVNDILVVTLWQSYIAVEQPFVVVYFSMQKMEKFHVDCGTSWKPLGRSWWMESPVRWVMSCSTPGCWRWTWCSVLIYIWVFPKIVVPQNRWFIMENPIKMDDLGVPLFLETPIWLLVDLLWFCGGACFEWRWPNGKAGMARDIVIYCMYLRGAWWRANQQGITGLRSKWLSNCCNCFGLERNEKWHRTCETSFGVALCHHEFALCHAFDTCFQCFYFLSFIIDLFLFLQSSFLLGNSHA